MTSTQLLRALAALRATPSRSTVFHRQPQPRRRRPSEGRTDRPTHRNIHTREHLRRHRTRCRPKHSPTRIHPPSPLPAPLGLHRRSNDPHLARASRHLPGSVWADGHKAPDVGPSSGSIACSRWRRCPRARRDRLRPERPVDEQRWQLQQPVASDSCRARHLFAAPCMCTCERRACRVASTTRGPSMVERRALRVDLGTVWGEQHGLVVGQGSGAGVACRAWRGPWFQCGWLVAGLGCVSYTTDGAAAR
jgi:hypothetical protein